MRGRIGFQPAVGDRVAKGDVVVVDGELGFRVTRMVAPSDKGEDPATA